MLTSPGQLSLLTAEWWLSLSHITCTAGGVICLLSLFSLLCTPALFTNAGVQLGRSAFPRICSLSSSCHSRDIEINLIKTFCTLVCNFQSSGLPEWAKAAWQFPSPGLRWFYFLDANQTTEQSQERPTSVILPLFSTKILPPPGLIQSVGSRIDPF